MPNDRFNTQVRTIKEPSSGQGVKPLPRGSKSTSMPERTANWPGTPGKSGPNRSAGVTKVKQFPKSSGL